MGGREGKGRTKVLGMEVKAKDGSGRERWGRQALGVRGGKTGWLRLFLFRRRTKKSKTLQRRLLRLKLLI